MPGVSLKTFLWIHLEFSRNPIGPTFNTQVKIGPRVIYQNALNLEDLKQQQCQKHMKLET